MSNFKDFYENPMRNLNNVTRYSGVFCMKPENDGYHTIDMMAMCMMMADKIELASSLKIDRRDLIYRCYLHDMDEALMGDISRNIKYYNDDIYKAVNDVANDIMSSTYDRNIINSIKSSKDIHDICGLIIKVSDTLQSSIKIYEECKLGNFHFNSILEENVGFVYKLNGIIRSSSLINKYPDAIIVLLDIVDDFHKALKSELDKSKY